MKKALYALSADPITNGHLNIIERASKMFDKLIVAIGNNNNKNYLFDLSKRREMVQKTVAVLNKKNNTKIKVECFNGALADFAFENDVNVVVRGLRNINDFQFEQDLANINKELSSELETCFLLTEQNNSSVSSSASKEIIKNNYTADVYLPLISKANLQKAINDQFFVGITGLMGSGKSYIAEQLERYSKNKEIKILNLDLDYLCHEVYNEKISVFEKQRQQLLSLFGTLDKKIIGEKVFSSPDYMKNLNNIFKPVIEYQVRKKSIGFKGVVLINGATIISMNLLSELCNNQLLMIKTIKEIRTERCEEGRKIPAEIIEKRDSIMLTYEEQEKRVKEDIKESNFGFYYEVKNNNNLPNIEKLYNTIIEKIRL